MQNCKYFLEDNLFQCCKWLASESPCVLASFFLSEAGEAPASAPPACVLPDLFVRLAQWCAGGTGAVALDCYLGGNQPATEIDRESWSSYTCIVFTLLCLYVVFYNNENM